MVIFVLFGGFKNILIIFRVLRVFWSFGTFFFVYIGHFLDFSGILVIFGIQ
jgi:hypothetical protein